MEVHNTLSRFHKIAERLRSAITEQMSRLSMAVAPSNLEFSVLNLRVTALREKAVNYEQDLQRLTDLEHAYAAVRHGLAAANLQTGISDVLLEIESVRRRIEFYTGALHDVDNSISFDEAVALQQQREQAPQDQLVSRHRAMPPVHLLSPEHAAAMRADLAILQRLATRLADKLADLNATKIKVLLPDSVADIVS